MIFALVLPGIMIYFMYSFVVPSVISSMINEDEKPALYAVNMPASMRADILALDAEFAELSESDAEKAKTEISESDKGILIVFPADFDSLVSAYDVSSGKPAPNVTVYYNSVSAASQALFSRITGLLDNYERSIANRFDINRDTEFDLATEEGLVGQIFSMIMPILLIMLLFTSCMSFAPDSIAGEKERGTLATMLVTPVKRHEIVIGKVIALSVIAVLGGVVSFLGTALALPKMIGFEEMSVNANVYSAADYALLLTVIITTVLLMISAVSVISAYAKTTKEAASLISPLMIIVILIAVLPMITEGSDDFCIYFIPFYNSVRCMNAIFSFENEPLRILTADISNLVYSAVLVLLMSRMFKSEKIMFAK